MFALKGALITSSKTVEDGVVVIDDDKIVFVGAGLPRPYISAKTIDCHGNFICPGFIDLHVQGAGGCDVLDGTYEAINTIAKTLAKNGTTAFLATTVIKAAQLPRRPVAHTHIAAVKEAMIRGTDGATVLGIHLEGPFVNPAKRGMIRKENVVGAGFVPAQKGQPQGLPLQHIIDSCGGYLKMMTIAPDVPGALDIIKRLKKNKIVASIGHTDATYDEAIKGFDAGITHATHMFNAMSGLHHRKPNAAGAILADERISVQLIADGRHLHPAVVKLVVKQKGPQKVALITDSMSAAGLPDGRYEYNGLEYESRDGLAVYSIKKEKGDASVFSGEKDFKKQKRPLFPIGTSLTLNKIVKRIVDMGAVNLHQAIEMASLTPAKVLGIDKKKGSLEVGKDADIVVMDKECDVKKVIIRGDIIKN